MEKTFERVKEAEFFKKYGLCLICKERSARVQNPQVTKEDMICLECEDKRVNKLTTASPTGTPVSFFSNVVVYDYEPLEEE